MKYALLAAAILLETAGTMSLRASRGFTRKPWIIPFALLTTPSFVALTFALDEGLQIGVAYGIWAAVGIGLTATLGHFVFNDAFNRVMAMGLVLIAIGALLIDAGGH